MSSHPTQNPNLPAASPGPDNLLRESFVCGVIAVDSQGKVNACSPVAARLLGVSAADLAAQPFAKLPAALRELVANYFATGRVAADGAIPLGGERVVHIHAVATPGAGGAAGLVLVLHDLMAPQQLEAKLRRLDRLANIGTLSAGLAHEVKNAIVAVRTFVDLLLERNEGAELAEIVRREMKRIDVIVSQMLRVAEMPKPEFSPVAAREALNYALQLVRPQLTEKGITLKTTLGAPADLVAGDLGQLEQAFLNLLLNAAEAMGPDGVLTVTTDLVAATTQQPAHFRVAIQDTGGGIAPENQPQLFTPFFTTKRHGTGLGLLITRRIIEAHHGRISVTSELNRGATFEVWLPLAGRA
jgi:signal transduction histidine kinase